MEPGIFAYQVSQTPLASLTGTASQVWACVELAAHTTELTSIHHALLRAIKDSGIDAALAAWITLAADPLEVSAASTNPSPPVSTAQRIWDDQCCKTHFGKLVHATSD